MAISVPVPKDISGIKTKVALNLTKRQVLCFGGAAAVGVPFYFLTRKALGTEISAVIMVALMLPFFFLAMYEKNGFPAEKVIYFIIRQKFLVPGIRPYRSESIYRKLEEREKLRKELYQLERKAQRGRRAKRCGKEAPERTAPSFIRRKGAEESTCHRAGDNYLP